MKTKKEEFIDKMSEQLKEWSGRIDELEAKVGGKSADVKTGYENRIRELKEKRDAVARKLEEVKVSGGEAWITMKTGLESAWLDLTDAIAAAREKFRKAA